MLCNNKSVVLIASFHLLNHVEEGVYGAIAYHCIMQSVTAKIVKIRLILMGKRTLMACILTIKNAAGPTFKKQCRAGTVQHHCCCFGVRVRVPVFYISLLYSVVKVDLWHSLHPSDFNCN